MDFAAIEIIVPLLVGFLLDLLIGDPLWIPHPVRFFGKIISWGEEKFNKGKNRFVKGGLLTICLVVSCWIILFLIFYVLKSYPIISCVLMGIGVFLGIANRNLIEEVLKVEKTLITHGLEDARKNLSQIVGRDTQNLSPNQVRIASLETLSENLSDGVIAPLFFFALGGIPAMFSYKVVNTLDSMIGYKTSRFVKFGKFAAITDDILNYMPARITAVLMVLVTLSFRGLKFIFKYGRKHTSPNSGYPEAALAGILNCRFGGSNTYQGQIVIKPYIGEVERVISSSMIKKACWVNMAVTVLFLILIAIFQLI